MAAWIAYLIRYKTLLLLILGLLLLFVIVLFPLHKAPLIIAGAITLVLLSAIYFYFIWKTARRSRAGADPERQPLLGTSSETPTAFSYQTLAKATKGFRNPISTGASGSVFKGTLRDGTRIAVKCLRTGSGHESFSAFSSHARSLSRLKHRNLINLLGVCNEASQRILVFEFMENGSLDQWIFSVSPERRKRLSWKTRRAIALEIAKALVYVREDYRPFALHLDIKPENILLDARFRPKISGLGTASVGPRHGDDRASKKASPAYAAPERFYQRGFTRKSDVFSFGIVLLEMLTGRRCVDHAQGSKNWYLPTVAYREARQGKFLRILDPCLEKPADLEEIVCLLKVGLWCVQWRPSLRPKMSDVVSWLKGDLQVCEPPLDQVCYDPPAHLQP
eukprot:TRINITY_DN33436_c0_g1_i1.p1 TRINITY_DN33436_c0_g1~~TRINITY_DN33436_c0_g1_i1.p1  ORF type:complete len:392 (-),score=-30.07 TRINITY_DN33436_c0_g1_i1:282-1457(-)